jgi:hypothetical protein
LFGELLPFTLLVLLQVTVSILRPNILILRGTYGESGNTIFVQTTCVPALLSLLPPSLTFSASRKLFPRRLDTASLELRVGKEPKISLNFLLPTKFGVRSLESSPPSNAIAPSSSGLSLGSTHKSIGIKFESNLPSLYGEWGVTFSELALRLMLGFEYNPSGIRYLCSGSWSNNITEIRTSVTLGAGVEMQLELVASLYLQHKLLRDLPIELPTWNSGYLCRY